MPRPNQPRDIYAERHVAERIRLLREAREMSYEGLAVQMKHQGCPINASGLFRIEKGDPPRRITVDELVAFSRVFGVSIEDLMLPPAVAASQEFGRLLVDWNHKREDASNAKAAEDAAWSELKRFVEEHPEAGESIEELMAKWVEFYFDEDKRDGALAMWMHDLTRAPEWEARVRDYLDDRRAERAEQSETVEG